VSGFAVVWSQILPANAHKISVQKFSSLFQLLMWF